MLTVTISDQLGNQMFAYASVKTIAQNRGEFFGFVRAKNNLINDTESNTAMRSIPSFRIRKQSS